MVERPVIGVHADYQLNFERTCPGFHVKHETAFTVARLALWALFAALIAVPIIASLWS